MLKPSFTAPAGALMTALSISACFVATDDVVGTDADTTGDGDGDATGDGDGGDGDGDGDPGDGDGEPSSCAAELDILLVVDNSGSMGEAQRRLALGIDGLIGPLDAAGVAWRLGITTTDNGNTWCPTTTPESGRLVLSSCRSRLGDFLFGGIVDDRELACSSICELQSVATSPTLIEGNTMATSRPWVEHAGGQSNLANGVSVAQALPCLVPQGVNGCGFESQLESAYLGLTRAQMNTEASFGFLRSGASLLVLIVSDEADCSSNKAWSEIFASDGNKTFWSDPGANFPTSAICWNAGVACTGDPSGYASCVAQDYDVDGAPTDTASAAVLHPIARYTGLLQGIEEQQRQLNPGAATRLALLGGVALDGSITYADSLDTTFQDEFGIGPGCESDMGGLALPPVRMREVAEASGGGMRSICADDFTTALTELVEPFVADCD